MASGVTLDMIEFSSEAKRRIDADESRVIIVHPSPAIQRHHQDSATNPVTGKVQPVGRRKFLGKRRNRHAAKGYIHNVPYVKPSE
jgi:hypothetical protein